MVLEQYAATFAYWGSISMLPLFVCPLIVCWNIIKFGFSDFFPPNTFLDGLLRSVLFYYHGKLLMSHDIMQQNLFGITLQLIYLALYYYYLYYKAPFHRAALKCGAFIAVTLLYASWESPVLAPQRFGYILTLLNLSTMIYPILGIKYVITAKTTFGLPYTIIFFGQVVTTLWLLFAISVHNYVFMGATGEIDFFGRSKDLFCNFPCGSIVAFCLPLTPPSSVTIYFFLLFILQWQMLIPFVLGVIQILLYFVYPNTPVFYNTQPTESNAASVQNETSETISTNATEKVLKDRKTRLAEMKMKKTSNSNLPDQNDQKKHL